MDDATIVIRHSSFALGICYCPGVAVGAAVGVPLIVWVLVIGVVGVGVASGVATGVWVAGGAVGCGVGGRWSVTVTFGAGSASLTPAGS
jgi:hypothetical protein